jgi:hypothetical protein
MLLLLLQQQQQHLSRFGTWHMAQVASITWILQVVKGKLSRHSFRRLYHPAEEPAEVYQFVRVVNRQQMLLKLPLHPLQDILRHEAGPVTKNIPLHVQSLFMMKAPNSRRASLKSTSYPLSGLTARMHWVYALRIC